MPVVHAELPNVRRCRMDCRIKSGNVKKRDVTASLTLVTDYVTYAPNLAQSDGLRPAGCMHGASAVPAGGLAIRQSLLILLMFLRYCRNMSRRAGRDF
jgi:hypothetical protein